MEYEQTDRFSMKVVEGKKTFLGYHTGLGNRAFTGVNLRDLRSVPGWLVPSGGGEPVPWDGEEIREIGGSLVLLGPWKPGRCFNPETDTSPGILKRIALAFSMLEKVAILPEIPGPANLYLCDDGSVIIFPPRFVAAVLGLLPVEEQFRYRDPWTHPLLKGRAALSRGMAVTVYRALTGEYPFFGQNGAEMRDRIREGNFLSACDAAAGLKPEFGAFVDSVLKEGEPEHFPAPEDWVPFLEKMEREGPFNAMDPQQQEAFVRRRDRERKQLDRQFGLKKTLTTRGVTFAVIGLILTGVLVLAGTVTASLLKPPRTRGMSEDQVVRAFYQGINELDYPLVMDCLGPDAETEDAATVKQEHIMAIQRAKNFGDRGIIRARDWLDAGQPPIPPFKILFGLTDFEYSRTEEGLIQVDYYRWYTDLGDGMDSSAKGLSQTVVLTGLRITDVLTLARDGQDWEIVRIDRKKEPHYSRSVQWSEGGSMFTGVEDPSESPAE